MKHISVWRLEFSQLQKVYQETDDVNEITKK